jgi:hypothetical protein
MNLGRKIIVVHDTRTRMQGMLVIDNTARDRERRVPHGPVHDPLGLFPVGGP